MSTSEQTGFKVPPTLAIIAVILVIAAISARVLTPGAFTRSEKVIQRDGMTVKDYVAKEGDTPASIAKELGGDFADKTLVAKADGSALPKADELLVAGTKLTVTMPRTDKRTLVVPGSYTVTERKSDGFLMEVRNIIASIFTAPIQGFQDKAEIIAFILIISGAFGMIMATGAVDAGLHAGVSAMAKGGADWVVIPLVMLFFSLGGAIFGMSEEIIPFVLITVPLAIRLGYDSVTGMSMPLIGSGMGFSAAFQNPFNVGIAQGIAELEPFSGWTFRFVVWILATSMGIAWVMRWAHLVKANPKSSFMYESDRALVASVQESASQVVKFGVREALVIAIVLGSVVMVGYGATAYGWYMAELSGVFLGAGVLSAIVGGLSVEKSVSAFLRGAGDLVGAALVVGLAAAIVVVLKQGNVLDTILNGIAGALEGTHSIVGACLMFVLQTLLNLVVPSGTGQAAMTMPIIAPLSDLIGVTRQTSVLAFQFGNGFGDLIIPTSAVTMSCLGVARIPYAKWFWHLLPLQVLLFVFGCAVLAVAVMTGYE